jgi:hypothetical protein
LTALVALGLSASTAVGAEARPRLALVDSTPVTFAGSGFVRGERVTITVRAGKRPEVKRTVRASRAGNFRASFGLWLATDPCEGTLAVRAIGSFGSRATWTRVCRPPSRPPG